FLDPNDPDVQAAARAEGIADDWLEAARRSPVYKLAVDWRIALPLHSEYATDPDDVFPAIERMRIPVEYLANLLSAGDADVIRRVLRRLAAMRGVMRKLQIDGERDEALARSVGLDVAELEAMYRLLAIAKYEDRYVIPKAHAELADRLEAEHAGCSVPGGPGGYGEVGYPVRRTPSGRRLNLLGGGK